MPGGRQTPGHSPCTCTLQLGTPGSGGAPGRGGDGTLGWGMLGDGGQVRVRVMLRDGSCSVRGCSGMGTFRDGDAQGWGMLRIAVRGCSGMGVPCLGPGARSGRSPVQHHSIRQGADEQVRVEVPIHIHPPRECVPKSPHPHTFPIQHLGTRTAVTLGTVRTPQPPSPPPQPHTTHLSRFHHNAQLAAMVDVHLAITIKWGSHSQVWEGRSSEGKAQQHKVGHQSPPPSPAAPHPQSHPG